MTRRFALATLLILIVMNGHASPSTALETGRLKLIVAACGECHGTDGISTAPGIPNLAGQDSVYMENQLEEFRHKPARELEPYQSHIRGSHIMDSKSQRFDAGELAAATRHFSTLRCAVGNRPPVETVSLRCGECHGNDGLSRKPGIPNLAGQREAYLLAQLKVFKATMLERGKVTPDQSGTAAGQSTRRYHRIMGQWAARLSATEMAAAARYYSNLPGIWVCK